MGFQINDIINGNPLGTIKIVEPDVWRGATHYKSNDNYGQNFYINCAARPEVQENNADLESEEYNNPQLHVYNCINEYCVNYNDKWYKPLSIVEMPTFDISKSNIIADDYENNNNQVADINKLNGGNFGHYGFYIKMLNFGGSKHGYTHQRLQYNQSDSYFQVNRDNDVNGQGILLWRIKTTTNTQHNTDITSTFNGTEIILQRNRFHLNPGKVVIFDTTTTT